MGEVGASSKAGMEVGFQKTDTKSEMAKAVEMNRPRENLAVEGGENAGTAADTSSYSVVKWERFLPKMALRVLLVEADDSTRQIIAALLRKCSYKVGAVSDGLKAWEVLRKGSENIDLILTEVELPSISGYALLTLMMEHDICKNIPVIMMSSQDSVDTVYKCMLRGAADFLVKPIRKNELRNLWQHVWRKQAKSRLAAGLGPSDESVAQENVEATAENNAVCNNSSDAQSSCWKPDLETEGAGTEQVNRLVPEETTKCLVDDINSNAQEESPQELGNTEAHEDETGDRYMERAYPSGSVNQVNDETKRFHSEASAFSRYISKSLQPHNFTSPSICYQQNDHETNARKHLSRYIPDYNSDTRARTVIPQKLVSVIAIPSGQSETTYPFSQKREISQPSSVRGVEVQNVMTTAASLIQQTQYAPFALPPPPAPTMNDCFRPFSQLNSFYPSDYQPTVSREFHNLPDLMVSKTSDRADENQCKKVEDREDRERLSPGNDQSVNGSSFDDQASNFHSACSGSNGKINSISLGPKCGNNEEGFDTHNEASHRSRQREVALTKFRLKRKDRCFEKKVRYESRKKLAEQRPRVKGQFVRQIASDAQPGSSSAGC